MARPVKMLSAPADVRSELRRRANSIRIVSGFVPE